MADKGKYECVLTNDLGAASSPTNVHVKKVYEPPKFTQKFTDIQQVVQTLA